MDKDKIVNIIYDYLYYMYCDNCRYDSEITDDEYHCEECYRKMNRWGISKDTCERIADKILEES